jgi:hypothetical protein
MPRSGTALHVTAREIFPAGAGEGGGGGGAARVREHLDVAAGGQIRVSLTAAPSLERVILVADPGVRACAAHARVPLPRRATALVARHRYPLPRLATLNGCGGTVRAGDAGPAPDACIVHALCLSEALQPYACAPFRQGHRVWI